MSFKVMSHTSKSVIKYIHLYIWGSVAVSLNEDAHVRNFHIFKQWKAQVKNETGIKVKYLRSLNEILEYKDTEFLELCKVECMTFHFTSKGTQRLTY
jgi:hypothetical protein